MNCAKAQSVFDSININRAKEAVILSFGTEPPPTFLIFIVRDNLIVISDSENAYEYWFYTALGFEDQKQILSVLDNKSQIKRRHMRERSKIKLDKLFNDCEICKQNELFFPDSLTSYPMRQTYNYFIMYRNRIKVCEYNMPYAFVENYQNFEFPLQKDHLSFLFNLVEKFF